MEKEYDYLIVGAGLFGAVFAHEAAKNDKKCLVIDKRGHIGGNIYTENIEGINVHRYGAHIFHTSDKGVWDYMNDFCAFNNFINSPVANYNGEIYSLPFNMYTFNRLWGVITPDEARGKIEDERKKSGIVNPSNLEEQAIFLVGRELYEKLIKGYTEKQWGRKCKDLPPFIIKRIPVRFNYDNNYFTDKFQGIPEGGYTGIVKKMLDGSDVLLNTDYYEFIKNNAHCAKKIVFTGAIDKYFGYRFGALEYRSVRFETEILDTDNYQGVAVMNFNSSDVPYTRVIEHKHFEKTESPKTVISREYSSEWTLDGEPYYPVNNERNNAVYQKYQELAKAESNVIFGGRLGQYKYYDMDKVVRAALDCAFKEFNA